jgi:glycosyltransferase involved in cell wall biosynthesis
MAADTESLEKQCASLSVAATKALRAQWQAEGLVFLFAGRLIPLKGISQLLAAWSRFEHHMPGAGTLVLVGSGSEEGVLRRQAVERNLKAVRFIGHVNYDHMASHYAAADVFVMPTLEDNWSLVVPEAMACGLPVLTSLYNGCWPELVHAGDNGWVFDALDPEDMLKCLERCVTCQSELRNMGQRSRDIVSHFTPRHAAASILKACEIALRHRAHP